MIDQVGSAGMMPPPRGSGGNTAMSDAQKTGLSVILANYDPEDLSDGDAKEIVSQIEELGITPGSDLASALSDAGIDAHGLAEQAGIRGPRGNGPPPPPPPGDAGGSGKINTEAVNALTTLLADAADSETGEVDWSNIFSSLAEQGYDLSEPFVDIRI